jgi:hypothetical protein
MEMKQKTEETHNRRRAEKRRRTNKEMRKK